MLHLEPWAESYEILPGKWLEIELIGIHEDDYIDSSIEENSISIVPPGDEIKIWDHEKKLIGTIEQKKFLEKFNQRNNKK